MRNELPPAYALRLAARKGRAVAPRHTGAFVLAADTVVACGRRILPKPADEKTARHCLELLSGRRHRVHCGVALVGPDGRLALRRVDSQVAFKRLSDEEIAAYLDKRRMARQSRRLCDPGPRRGPDPVHLGLILERRRLAVVRDRTTARPAAAISPRCAANC